MSKLRLEILWFRFVKIHRLWAGFLGLARFELKKYLILSIFQQFWIQFLNLFKFWVSLDSGFRNFQIFQVWLFSGKILRVCCLQILIISFCLLASYTKEKRGYTHMLTLVESFWQSTPISDDNSVDFSNCFLGK